MSNQKTLGFLCMGKHRCGRFDQWTTMKILIQIGDMRLAIAMINYPI